jgi:hypothetical protein
LDRAPGRPVGTLILAIAAAGLAALVLAIGGEPLLAVAAYSLGGAGLMLAPVARAALARRLRPLPLPRRA